MGGSEIIVILIVALLFLGPEKLPQATKQISKTIRDLKKQSRALQAQIEGDEQIGGAIRDLKSALRGDEIPARSIRPPKKAIDSEAPTVPENSILKPEDQPALACDQPALPEGEKPLLDGDKSEGEKLSEVPPLSEVPALSEPKVTLPLTAGEADGPEPSNAENAELAAMIKPAAGTVAKGS